jgi:hypothetical protein
MVVVGGVINISKKQNGFAALCNAQAQRGKYGDGG